MKKLSNNSLFFETSKHIDKWQQKLNRNIVGYYEAKGYSNRKNFKRNQRKGL
jgi:hypothetical protein